MLKLKNNNSFPYIILFYSLFQINYSENHIRQYYMQISYFMICIIYVFEKQHNVVFQVISWKTTRKPSILWKSTGKSESSEFSWNAKTRVLFITPGHLLRFFLCKSFQSETSIVTVWLYYIIRTFLCFLFFKLITNFPASIMYIKKIHNLYSRWKYIL